MYFDMFTPGSMQDGHQEVPVAFPIFLRLPLGDNGLEMRTSSELSDWVPLGPDNSGAACGQAVRRTGGPVDRWTVRAPW
ncbi:hypothetical protein GCM10009868_31100 [Terrabacter aerolatus]|uniref:Uncharacterized protein n=1 Tax=Terrabacter aerolatus TaxID=422442 RepID=A0A512D6P9_9MICO|nr:hypothetical protein TAE01_39650 [Terrabacter aerolatus]